MRREQHSLPKKRLNRLPSIEAKPRSIEQCEQRLALSASLAGDLLLELLDVDWIQDDTDATGPDLIQQSAELRAEQGLDGSGQTVAVIDSGVAWDHVALGGDLVSHVNRCRLRRSERCAILSFTNNRANTHALNPTGKFRAASNRSTASGSSSGIDPKSMVYLDGTELDFVREGLNEGLQFRNPNVSAECGCGESFTV